MTNVNCQPHGILHGSRASYSQETQKMLKVMMEESKLTNFQQRQLDRCIKSGNTLPKNCPPTSNTNKPKNSPIIKYQPGKPLNPKNYKSHVKSKMEIEATGAYEREKFQPAPMTKFGADYQRDKEKLRNMMAFGEDIDPKDKKKLQPIPRTPSPPLHVDRFDEIQKEIEERREFLEQMEKVGKAAQYRTIIETEISKMVREMEIIDNKRNAELNRLLIEKRGQ